MINLKKVSWILLYLTGFIPVGLSLYFYTEKNLTFAIGFSIMTLLIYTILIFKNIKILSIVSFFSMLLMFCLMFSFAGARANNVFSSIFDEKIFMLTLSLIIFFLLINSIFWIQTKKGLLKIISIFFTFLSICLLIVWGGSLPDYHQNFVYTRVNILILLLFGIFLIIKKKKLLGILGIFLSIGILLLSTSMFAKKVYTLEDKEKNEVIAYVDPMAKEMFDYYNKKDYDNFCKYCGFALINMMNKDPITIKDKRELSGPYTHFGEPSEVIRKSGRYYVEYPIKFQNVKDQMYLTFVIENISSDPSIYGYALSDKQGLHTGSGDENERDKQ